MVLSERLSPEPPAAATPAARLPWRTLLIYAVPGAGSHFLSMLVMVMSLNFASDVLGVSTAAMGSILFSCKIWDALLVPVVGHWSDRTRLRLGRRKPWLLASAAPLALFSLMIFAPPAALAGPALVAWLAASVLGFYAAFTSFEVPHMALGAELTQEVQGRNRVFGIRMLVNSLGLLAAITFGAAVLEDLSRARENAFWLVAGTGSATALLVALAVAALPPERRDYAGRGGQNLWRSLRDVLGNPHARLLLLVLLIETVAIGGMSALMPFVARYVVEVPDVMAELFLVFTLPTIFSIPLWMWLGQRFERRKLWRFAMAMASAGFSLQLFLDRGTIGLMAVSALVAGTALGCGASLGDALKADVIDYDELATGERKEGAYFATWNLVQKLATGLMLAVVGIGLDRAGFAPGAEQAEAVRDAIRFLMGGLPALAFAIGCAVLGRFRLGQAEHGSILEVLEARRALRRREPA
jgi:GPH family glycoside/pentoside/hexuronide:cation symporter